jgi:hypothetical protein
LQRQNICGSDHDIATVSASARRQHEPCLKSLLNAFDFQESKHSKPTTFSEDRKWSLHRVRPFRRNERPLGVWYRVALGVWFVNKCWNAYRNMLAWTQKIIWLHSDDMIAWKQLSAAVKVRSCSLLLVNYSGKLASLCISHGGII